MTTVDEHVDEPTISAPSIAVALQLLTSARNVAARRSTPFSVCVVGSSGELVLVVSESGGRPEAAISAARSVLGLAHAPDERSAGAILPDLELLGGRLNGAIGIAAPPHLAEEILAHTLRELDKHVERFLRQ